MGHHLAANLRRVKILEGKLVEIKLPFVKEIQWLYHFGGGDVVTTQMPALSRDHGG